VLFCPNESESNTLRQSITSEISRCLFGEKEKFADPDFGFRHDLLHWRIMQLKYMETVSQGLSRELRSQMYSCVFCDSVWKRLQEGDIHNNLESLYLEHIKKFHGLTI